MQIITTISELRATLKNRGRIAFAPTMGNLHDGHLSLMAQAREHGDIVTTSLFVNRLQFGPNEDFDSYPRTFNEDCEKMAAAGVDVLLHRAKRNSTPSRNNIWSSPPGLKICSKANSAPATFAASPRSSSSCLTSFSRTLPFSAKRITSN